VQLVFKISNLCAPDTPTLQTNRQTDRRHAISIPALCTIVHRAVKKQTHQHQSNYWPFCKDKI